MRFAAGVERSEADGRFFQPITGYSAFVGLTFFTLSHLFYSHGCRRNQLPDRLDDSMADNRFFYPVGDSGTA
jgi:hypothetical protein